MTDGSPLASISPRYEVLELLGQGGMGRVYKTRDLTLNREVAIKLLIGQCTAQNAPRFQREAKSMSRLKHKNLIEVYDFGVTEQGNAYLVMELVNGTMLSEILKERNHLSVEETIELSLAIADGMYHAHNKHIVHRDLKPSNIMILNENHLSHIKVFDFGISKELDKEEQHGELTAVGSMVGTPLYMSPEQAQGRSVDERSDLYSLGCIMYLCLTGKPPLIGDTAVDTITMHIHDHPTSLTAYSNLQIPKALDAIVMKLLAKNPQERFDSMAALSEALVEASSQSSIAQNPNVVHIRKERSTKDLVRLGIVLVTTLIGTGLLFVAWLIETSHPTVAEQEIASIQIIKRNETVEDGRAYANLTKYDDGMYTDENHADPELSKGFAKVKASEFANLPKKKVKRITIHNYTRFDQGAFEEMATMPNILELIMYNESITGAKIKSLNKMKSLERLRIKCHALCDADLENLDGLPQLKYLNLQTCGIADRGVTAISKNFPNLEILDIGRTLMSGETIADLRKLPKLKHLAIDHMDLDDKILANIKGMPSLIALCLTGNTKVSESAVRQLILNNPHLELIETAACPKISSTTCEKIAKEFASRHIELPNAKTHNQKSLEAYRNEEVKRSEKIDQLSEFLGRHSSGHPDIHEPEAFGEQSSAVE
jgi:serine/threonine protein kinase